MNMTPISVEKAFGIGVPPEFTVPGYPEASALTPRLEQEWRPRRSELSTFLAWWMEGGDEPIQIFGPTGSGKSSLVAQVFARLNVPALFVGCHRRMEMADLVQETALVAGNTLKVDGPLLRAMKGGYPLVLEEADLLDESVALGLNLVAEGRPLVFTTDDDRELVVYPEPGFRLLALGNTGGLHDPTGSYLGTRPQNLSFLDRFWAMHVDYPDAATELEILTRRNPDFYQEVHERLIEIANAIRTGFKGEGDTTLSVTLSTRGLIRCARLVKFFWGGIAEGVNPFTRGIDLAMANRAPAEEREVIHELVQRIVGDDLGQASVTA